MTFIKKIYSVAREFLYSLILALSVWSHILFLKKSTEIRMDCETGEILNVQNQSSSYFDVETGEVTYDDEIKPQCNGHRNRAKFTVPKSCLKQKIERKKSDKYYLSSTQETFSLASKKKVIELKEVIITRETKFMIKISLHIRYIFFAAVHCNLELHFFF